LESQTKAIEVARAVVFSEQPREQENNVKREHESSGQGEEFVNHSRAVSAPVNPNAAKARE
jgi:hypothetical protein